MRKAGLEDVWPASVIQIIYNRFRYTCHVLTCCALRAFKIFVKKL